MKSKRWGLTLDVGHMHSAGYVDDDVYIVHSGKLRHMHLHDALLMQAPPAAGRRKSGLERFAAHGGDAPLPRRDRGQNAVRSARFG